MNVSNEDRSQPCRFLLCLRAILQQALRIKLSPRQHLPDVTDLPEHLQRDIGIAALQKDIE